jgi:type IV pilus assembly protein PilN
MKVTLNLASQPYIDLRSVLKRLRIIMLALALLAIALFFLLHREEKKAGIAIARVDAIHGQVQSLERQQQSYVALMRQPQNAAVLAQSDYLNGLFRQKAFSWTATMTDLETVLPAGVQVLSLDPAITKSGRVEIHLRVSGARDRAIQLVQNLEKSRHFADTRISGETQAQGAGQNNNSAPLVSTSSLVNFDILADYRPLTAAELASGNATKEQRTTASAGKISGGKTARRAGMAKKREAQ